MTPDANGDLSAEEEREIFPSGIAAAMEADHRYTVGDLDVEYQRGYQEGWASAFNAAGHRIEGDHDCFKMNCRTLGREVERLGALQTTLDAIRAEFQALAIDEMSDLDHFHISGIRRGVLNRVADIIR